MSMIPAPAEFHLSIRVSDLDASTAFYAAFLAVAPKARTARFSTFIAPDLRMNLGRQDLAVHRRGADPLARGQEGAAGQHRCRFEPRRDAGHRAAQREKLKKLKVEHGTAVDPGIS